MPASMLVLLVVLAIALAIHLSITMAVYRNAKAILHSALGISPGLWLCISLFFPIGGMFIYWLMNHSILNKENQHI